jgi:hypothetical protein
MTRRHVACSKVDASRLMQPYRYCSRPPLCLHLNRTSPSPHTHAHHVSGQEGVSSGIFGSLIPLKSTAPGSLLRDERICGAVGGGPPGEEELGCDPL